MSSICEHQREKAKYLTLFAFISGSPWLLVSLCKFRLLSCVAFLNSIPCIRIHGLYIHRSYVALLYAEVMEKIGCALLSIVYSTLLGKGSFQGGYRYYSERCLKELLYGKIYSPIMQVKGGISANTHCENVPNTPLKPLSNRPLT